MAEVGYSPRGRWNTYDFYWEPEIGRGGGKKTEEKVGYIFHS